MIRKVSEADVVIWLDEVRFTQPGWMNQNVLSDGQWLTVPIVREDHRTKLRDVLIDGSAWQLHHADLLRTHGAHDLAAIVESRDWSGERLVRLNRTLIDRILELVGIDVQQVDSSRDRMHRRPISERIVASVSGLGGDVYLAAPSAMDYLDPSVFERAGIELRYHRHEGDNPCVVDVIAHQGTKHETTTTDSELEELIS